ncbi:MAG: RdgB/HAM1 family non-canonical purine NTP pyrophosphatase [Casimicrobiaceae bacterium]
MNKLVVASGNPGKLRELAGLLEPLGIEIMPQDLLGICEAEEPHDTFVENALAKARHVARACGLPALADDSGICVHALGGAPGTQSARYAGAPRSDTRNNEKLLSVLAGVTDRRAHFYCVIVLMRHGADPQPLIAEGEWHGEILRVPRGSGGFGYDPLFHVPELGLTSAELPLDRKNAVSHRGRALARLLERMHRTKRALDDPSSLVRSS